jgi:hypothetical protein
MRRFRFLLATGALCSFVAISAGDPPALPQAKTTLPVGKWTVEFANGVVEQVELKKDGTATVTEPARTSDGKATSLGGAVLIVCDDDRLERWTPVRKRMVVEHWSPSSQFPTGVPVRGIADPAD